MTKSESPSLSGSGGKEVSDFEFAGRPNPRRADSQGVRRRTSAEKLSDDLRKSEEGMLDREPLTFPRGELSPEMEKVAFALKQGEWAEVDDTPSRLLLIQLVSTDRKQLGQVTRSKKTARQEDAGALG